MTEYERHKLTETCDEHLCSDCKYDKLDEDTEEPCKSCFDLDECYFVPKEVTIDERV